MSMRRITISVPEEIARKAQRAADSGLAESVSAYFATLAAREPDWAEARAAVAELTKGKRISAADRAWAQKLLASADKRRGAA